MEKICPFCGKKVKVLGKHLLHCKLIPNNLSRDEIKLIGIESYVYKDFLKDLCEDYNNLYSLPDLRKKYGIDLKNICWCLQYSGIKLRNISESQHKISKIKSKKTCLEKYGVENPSQVPEIQKKKEETFIKHYGVNNIWKTKEYAEFTSKRWASYNKEKKLELIHKWTHQEGCISKLENKIVNMLNNLNIPIETQFKFSKYFHKYDIYIKNTNVLVEIQGDFWHANPQKYNENDILNFPGNKQIAVKDIWKKDLQNIHYAESQGYKVIQIWEQDINNCDNLEIYLLDIFNKLIN